MYFNGVQVKDLKVTSGMFMPLCRFIDSSGYLTVFPHFSFVKGFDDLIRRYGIFCHSPANRVRDCHQDRAGTW